jgi:hypothetical protein
MHASALLKLEGEGRAVLGLMLFGLLEGDDVVANIFSFASAALCSAFACVVNEDYRMSLAAQRHKPVLCLTPGFRIIFYLAVKEG